MGWCSACVDCGAVVSLIDGEAVVRDGQVALRCRVCPEDEPDVAIRDPEPVPVEVTVVARERRPGQRTLIAAGAVAAVAGLAATGLWAQAHSRTSAALAVPRAVDPAPRLVHVAVAAPESPIVHALTYSLTDEQAELPWVHPLAGERELPAKHDRRFGAERPGHRPAECGAGHCGVDLGDERGQVVHAALGGRVIRVKRDAGSRSGRYVAIEHPQGLRSRYMHLDRIHPDLVVGMEIASGEPIGLLGTSGIRNSPPHLHFTVERKSDSGWQYVDPEPMLTQATVLDSPAPLPPAPERLSLDLSRASELPMPPKNAEAETQQ